MQSDSVIDLAARGAEMTAGMISRLRRSGVEGLAVGRTPEGPYFVYGESRHLFLGRRGRGPLHVAWDTNLLIDYFEHGERLWANDSLPARVAGEYGEELEALQLIISLWVVRDIRFHILESSIDDGPIALAATRRTRRRHAWEEFCAAISLVADDEDRPHDTLLLPASALEAALEHVPEGYDRELIRGAVASRHHVFLTRDKGILAARNDLRPFGLHIASPQDLVEDLAGAGALHCLFHPRHLYWPAPDQQRVAHLIQALEEPTESATRAVDGC